jgi:hypothetical protein
MTVGHWWRGTLKKITPLQAEAAAQYRTRVGALIIRNAVPR